MADFVTLESRGPIGIVRIDRPPLNEMNLAVARELRSVAFAAADDPRIRAVVLDGGPTVFAVGADIAEVADADFVTMLTHTATFSAAIDAVARIPKPVVAAVAGHALGGGCELALAADFRICGLDSQLGLPEILLGIMPGGGATQRLPRLVGIARAKELIFSGRVLDAAEALRIGLVDQVAENVDVFDAALELAGRFAAGPAVALRAAKAALDLSFDVDLATGLRAEASMFASLFATDDRSIGMDSFFRSGPGEAEFVGR